MLINRNFALLWWGQLVSQLGDKAYTIALMWWLLEQTGSPTAVSAFLVVSVLPELIFGPVAGVYIDRWNKQTILVAADCVRGFLVLSLAVLHWCGSLAVWHIYAAAMSISLCSALFNPAAMAVIPAVVGSNQLQRANSLSQLIAGSETITGPLLGAGGVAWLGYLVVLAGNGCSYLLSGLAAASLRLAPQPSAAREPVWTSLRQGLEWIAGNRPVRVIAAVVALIHLFVGCLVVVLPFLAKSLAGEGIAGLGVLQAMLGVGIMGGAAAFSRRGDERFSPRPMLVAIPVMGLAMLLMGAGQLVLWRSLAPYAAVCLLLGGCIAVVSVCWRTLAQSRVPADKSGRVFSVLSTTADLSLPLAMAVTGILLDAASPAAVLLSGGAVMAGTGLLLAGRAGSRIWTAEEE